MTLACVAIVAVVIYALPAGTLGTATSRISQFISHNGTSAGPSQNFLKEQHFLKTYNISLFGDTTNVSLGTFYGQGPSEVANGLVISCDYEIPSPMPPTTLEYINRSGIRYNTSTYDIFEHYVGLLTICGVYSGLPACSSIKNVIKSFVMQYFMNLTYVFAYTKNETRDLYDLIMTLDGINSTPLTKPIYDNAIYDENLLANVSENNVSAEVSAMLGLRQIPEYVYALPNNTDVRILPFPLLLPFQYPLLYFPQYATNDTNCNDGLHLFYLTTNLADIYSGNYTVLYKGLDANVTNICVNSTASACSPGASAKVGISFYAQS